MTFHGTFNTGGTPSERTHFLRDYVNQGWPAASAFKLALSIATHLMAVANIKPAAVRALTPREMQASTVTKTDIQCSHLWLDATGTFQECVLMAQVTPKTARVLLQDVTEVVSCRSLWPWIPRVHAQTVSTAADDASTMTSAELLYAHMCEPRGSSAVASHSAEPTHMFLNTTNTWTPCSLLSMISLELCDVVVNGVGRDVPVALMANYDADIVSHHVTHVASKALFSNSSGSTTVDVSTVSAQIAGATCWQAYRGGRTVLQQQPAKFCP